MKRVTGIGGVFLKSKNPDQLRAWYKEHLGFDLTDWGGAVFQWNTPDGPTADGATVWSIFDHDSDYFAPSTAPFMINYRVDDLDPLLAALREEGCEVDDKTEDGELGKFGWVIDSDGNRVELWEPPKGNLK
jgi:predicted enzyme related to lactoylglutathione lyase